MERVFGPALKAASGADTAPQTPSVTAPSKDEEPEDANTQPMSRLARFVTDNFRVNVEARERNGVSARLKYAISAQSLHYTKEQEGLLAKAGINKRVYAPITATKIRAAKSMLVELASYGTEAPFAIDPTPDPEVPKEVGQAALDQTEQEIGQAIMELTQNGEQEIPPEVFQTMQRLVAAGTEAKYDRANEAVDSYARVRAKRLERRVQDILVQGNFDKARAKCIDNVCTYGTCVMVGPVMRNVAHNRTVHNSKTGVYSIERTISPVPWFEALNPQDCYPAPDAEEITDGVFCARIKYTREQLWRFRKATARSSGREYGESAADSGWRDNAIAMLLDRHEYGCKLDEFTKDGAVLESENNVHDENESCRYEGIRAFAFVDGKKLLEIGIEKNLDGDDIDDDEFYYVEAIVIDGLVVYCRIHDERIGIPLSKGVFYELPGSWWGESIADKLYSVQSAMNNAVVSLLRNMGPASSPMIWIQDISRLSNKSSDAVTAEPGKVFAFASQYSGQTSAGAPMGVIQLPSNASELIAVSNWATKQSDLDSGIPAFAEGTGSSNGGALRTAEGLRTYTEAASRGMKNVMLSFDSGIICDTVRRVADWVMVNDDDMNVKGDVEVRPVGVMGRLHKAQNDQARVQLLNLCLNSQFMTQLIGTKGIVELFRPSCKDVGINPDNVCPSPERVEMLEMMNNLKQLGQAMAPSMGVQGGAAAAAEQNAEAEAAEGGGQVQGVQPIAQVGGGVEGRRGAA